MRLGSKAKPYTEIGGLCAAVGCLKYSLKEIGLCHSCTKKMVKTALFVRNGPDIVDAAELVKKATTHIYFLQDESGPIKIGRGEETKKRIHTLQIGNPRKLELLYHFRAIPAAEAHLHEIFAEHRIRGEWFEPEPVIDFLDAFKRGEYLYHIESFRFEVNAELPEKLTHEIKNRRWQ